ncbi:YlaI family protein [Fictibacillus sp. Mic-4]|uniref:YlaI family protein n=1 Tax=Fictibacillus TaxID=1329200 RepID=UPI00040A529F|nr:YlaI family protein [Fictibacillus gelatini]
MRVKCVLCDTIHTLDDLSAIAKKLRNRPIHTYMCDPCHERITNKTNDRKATGNFILYRSPAKENEW